MRGLVKWIIALAMLAAICAPLAFSGWVVGSVATAAEIVFWVAAIGLASGLAAGAWLALQTSRKAVARNAVDPLGGLARRNDAERDEHLTAPSFRRASSE